MTRSSERELKRDIGHLIDEASSDSPDLMIVWKDEQTGDWFVNPDDSEPIPPATVENVDPLMIIEAAVVDSDWDSIHRKPE